MKQDEQKFEKNSLYGEMGSQPKKSLRERAAELATNLPEFTTGCEKGDADTLLGQISVINEFGFADDPSKPGHDYAVFMVEQRPRTFFFGGKVLTDQLHKLEDEGYGEEIRRDGLPVLFERKTSRNKTEDGRGFLKYTNVVLYPEG